MNSKKSISTLLIFILIFSISINSYGKVAVRWYQEPLEFGIKNNIIKESEDILDSVDYRYVLDSLFRIENRSNEVITEENVKNWAHENQIISDSNITWDQDLTRQELADIISRYTKSLELKYDTSNNKLKNVLDYKDISDDYRDRIAVLYNLGIMVGNDKGYINPKKLASKAEFLKILLNLDSIKNNVKDQVLTGTVLDVSKYGNITTSINLDDFKSAGFELGDILKIKVNDNLLTAPYGDNYSNVDNRKEIILADKENGKIMVAINMGNFSKTYGAVKGTSISFAMDDKEGYKDEYEIRSIDKYRTNIREDYESDEVFANFREISMGNIVKETLYRSSSPINPEIGRASYADKLLKKHRINTVINLADSKEELESYFEQDNFNSPYYKELYENGKVIFLNMGVDFESEDFQNKLRRGFKFLSENEGPFLVHCNEGKDRAGFASIVLEALMGASVDEIKEDYMTTYENFYFVKKGTKQYDKIAESNVLKSLKMISGVEKEEELYKINLAEKTEEYLENIIGLTKEEIGKIKLLLSGAIENKQVA